MAKDCEARAFLFLLPFLSLADLTAGCFAIVAVVNPLRLGPCLLADAEGLRFGVVLMSSLLVGFQELALNLDPSLFRSHGSLLPDLAGLVTQPMV